MANENLSTFGSKVILSASINYPMGVEIEDWADDADPFGPDNVTISEYGISLNGALLSWQQPAVAELEFSVWANSDSDRILRNIFDTDSIRKGKAALINVLTLSVQFPDGEKAIFTSGKMLSGPPSSRAQQGGRKASKTYRFVFNLPMRG